MEKNNYEIIQEWHALLKNGTITEEEFAAKKSQLLNGGKIHNKNIEHQVIEPKIEIEKSKGLFDNSVLLIVGIVCVLLIGAFFYTRDNKSNNLDNENTVMESDTTTYDFDRAKEEENTTKYKNEPIVVKEDVVAVENNTDSESVEEYNDSYDKPLEGNYIVNANEDYLVYFYETPDLSRKKKAYFSTEDKVYISEFKNGFGYVEFLNSRGQKSVGWLQLAEISYCNDCN